MTAGFLNSVYAMIRTSVLTYPVQLIFGIKQPFDGLKRSDLEEGSSHGCSVLTNGFNNLINQAERSSFALPTN